MTPQEFIDSQQDVERRYECEGGVYLIRDRWELSSEAVAGFRLKTCEYAVKGPDGEKVWKSCPEGVRLRDIELFEQKAAD